MEKTWWTNISNPEQLVIVDWENNSTILWNETCAKVLEVFGLPGIRYYFRPRDTNMLFIFKSAKDASLCRILLSEVL